MKSFPNSNSQASQESFVLNVLQEKYRGYYVEVGGHHATYLSNTYVLESKYEWLGVSLEIDSKRCLEYNEQRKNICLNKDGTTFNYLDYFISNNFPKQIDYLQLDIEPAINTLSGLKAMPLNEYRFSIITFETDLYLGGENSAYQKESQDILNSFGYELVVENVMHDENKFEDWWVDKSFIPVENYIQFKSKNIDHRKIFWIS